MSDFFDLGLAESGSLLTADEWRRRRGRAISLVDAGQSVRRGPVPLIPPGVEEEQGGLRLMWSIDGELVRVDVLDPARGYAPPRREGWLRPANEVAMRFGSGPSAPIVVWLAGGAAGAAGLAFGTATDVGPVLLDGIIGAGAAVFGVLGARASLARHWRVLEMAGESPTVVAAVRRSVAVHARAIRLLAVAPDDVDAHTALQASRALLWALAVIAPARRGSDPGQRVFEVDDHAPDPHDVAGELQAAAERLDVALEAYARRVGREVTVVGADRGRRSSRATRRELHARARLVRRLEAAQAAATLAEMAAADLASDA